MDIYELLLTMSDDEVDSFVKKRIDQLEKESSNKKPFLGYYAENTPKSCIKLTDEKGGVVVRCFHKGYIKKDTKFVYGFNISPEGEVDNEGSFYYFKNQQYIYDFCKFIRNMDLEDEYDLFDAILLFMRNYFGRIRQVNRDDMFHLLYDKDGKSFPVSEEHELSSFKGKGSAMCSEFASMAQNLLSVLGIESYMVLGAYTLEKHKTDNHAFNFVTFTEKNEEGEEEVTSALVDFAEFCNIYNYNVEKIGETPFLGYLDQFDDDFLVRFLYQEEHLKFQNHYFGKVGNTDIIVRLYQNRDYFANNDIIGEKTPIQKKKER